MSLNDNRQQKGPGDKGVPPGDSSSRQGQRGGNHGVRRGEEQTNTDRDNVQPNHRQPDAEDRKGSFLRVI